MQRHSLKSIWNTYHSDPHFDYQYLVFTSKFVSVLGDVMSKLPTTHTLQLLLISSIIFQILKDNTIKFYVNITNLI